MEFRITQRELSRLVSRAASVIDSRDAKQHGLLGCVRVSADKGLIEVQGSSSFLNASASCEAAVAKPGAIAVNSGEFAKRVDKMPKDVIIKASDKKLEMRDAKSKAKKPLFELPYLAEGDDFPPLPVPTENAAKLVMPSAYLGRLLAQASYAASTDESRSFMACVLLKVQGERATCAATDGHRLALASAVLEGASDFSDSVHMKALRVVQRLCSEMEDESVHVFSAPTTNGGYLHFRWPTVSFSVKRVEDAFPPYERIVPKSFAHHVNIPREALMEAVSRVELSSKDATGNKQIVLELSEGQLALYSQSGESGSSRDEIEVAYDGPYWRTGVDPDYFNQALGVIHDDDVVLSIGDPLAPIHVVGRVDPQACMSVIMPMRLDGVK